MTYVLSNIHGNYEKFKELLAKISFKDTDVMYILGDLVDYGEGSIELINDISMRYNLASTTFAPTSFFRHLTKCYATAICPSPRYFQR